MNSLLSSDKRKGLGLLAAVVLLAASGAASLLFGLQRFEMAAVVQAYTSFTGSDEQLIIRTSRVPRALTAAVIGCSLALAGALLQAMTRNPLASPSLLGVNAGASLAIVAMLYGFGDRFVFSELMWFGFMGAGMAASIIVLAAALGRGGMTPLKLILMGSALASFAASLTSLFMLLSQETLEGAMFWLTGSVSNSKLEHTVEILPYFAAAWVIALSLSRSLNVMAMGEEVAAGLGHRIGWSRMAVFLAVVLLAGGSVALAGPIAFIGIMIPHLSRWIVGNDHRWVLPYCAVLGAAFLLLADLLSRFILEAKEVPVGVTTALLGIPFVVVLARRKAIVR
ncbi:iron ABC transporter permease [Paenibacillus albicereus]|uniref:Iron ABC transporter permease n=1 Tax=Paenibacillus albicereus TaxID=2726185 RepID=A0A6H2GS66_9BACL|nr:iron ABC transporter permease [Paenibacillus albicereus]QJC50271.1 iron ABC transporter permease [Paenibacillus albicereus]